MIVRVATTSWAALASWRCVYILLENNGLDLEQLDWMVSWRLPSARRVTGKYSWLVTLTLSLIWPSQFAAPLPSGAVDWKASLSLNGTMWVTRGDGNYSNYVYRQSTRKLRIDQAVTEFTAVSMATATQSNHDCRRYIETERVLPPGSVLENAMLPCITIHGISWDNPPPIKAVEDLLIDPTNLSLPYSPLVFSEQSKYLTTAILNLEPWDLQSPELRENVNGTTPPPSLFTG